ncbi:MAG: phage tail tape measure protein [Planctomycetota bacterium]|jgi:TP901 family phage tail tape measure protein
MPSRKEKTVAAILTAETGQLRREMTKAGGYVGGFTKKVERASVRMKTAMRNIGFGNVTSRLKGMVGSIAAFAGIYGLGKLLSDVKDFEAGLTDLAITADRDNVWMDKARKKIMDVSSKYAIGRNEVLNYVSSLVELSGNSKLAIGTVEQMGMVATATGASMGDLASMMFQLSSAMGVTEKQSYAVLNAMRAQEKIGSVAFRDIATVGARVFGIAGKFGQGAEATTAATALMQITARGYGKTEKTEAASASQRFLIMTMQNQKKIEKTLGVQLKTAGGKWKKLGEIYKIIGGAMADPAKQQLAIENMLFGRMGIRSAMELGAAHRRGEFEPGAGRTSARAILGAGKRDVLKADLARRMESTAFKFQQSMIKMSNTLHSKMLPAFEKLSKFMPSIAQGVGWLVNNLQTLGVLLAAWKAAGLVRGWKTAGAAAALGGVGGATTATMNVRAGTVNVMGGAGGRGGGGMAGPMPSGTRNLGPATGGKTLAQRRWWQGWGGTAGTALGASVGGITAPLMAALAPFVDWKAGETSPEKRKRIKEADVKAAKERQEGGAPWYEEWAGTSWMFAKPALGPQVMGAAAGAFQQQQKDLTPTINQIGQRIELAIRQAMKDVTVGGGSNETDKNLNARINTGKAT